jgi:DNA polymerase-1
VEGKFGVGPAHVPDYLGLMGDSSDNIPGVPSVGAKTATKLLQQYTDIEGIYAHADQIKGKLGENIRANQQLAYDSRKVATILRDAPVDLDISSLHFPDFNPATLTGVMSRYGLRSQLGRLLRLLPSGTTPGSAKPGQNHPLEKGESKNGSKIPPFQGGGASATGVVGAEQPNLFAASELPQLKIPEYDERPAGEWAFKDAELAAYVVDASKHYKDVQELAIDYLDINLTIAPEGVDEQHFQWALLDALKEVLLARIEADGLHQLYYDIELPLTPVLEQMEAAGVKIDSAQLEAMAADFQSQLQALTTRAYSLAGQEFNLDSPKQVGEVLFERLGLPHGKKKKTGYSTDAKTLKGLMDKHELPGVILEYRELAKLKGTYLDALPRLADAQGRVHTTFNQTVTATGRLSSSDPNLQNIPVRTPLGREIRKAFVADPAGALFVSADYSQIELRLLAHLSGDEHLIEAFLSGEDFHTETAAKVFGVPTSEVTKEMRSRAKAVNFGIVYGQQAFGLSDSLKISFGEAKDLIDTYYATYPQVKTYLDGLVSQAYEQGYVETMFGRRRYIRELKSPHPNLRNFGERTAMNHPMQGSAADIIKLAMIEVARRTRSQGMQAEMILQVHDELCFNCPAAEYPALKALLEEVMQQVVKLKVPLLVEVNAAANWADAH